MASETDRVELLPGTLDLIVLRALSTMGPQHAYGLAARLEQVAEHPLTLNQGTLYPALVRLEQRGHIKGGWQKTENNREAKYYSITRSGTRALEKETVRWRRLAPEPLNVMPALGRRVVFDDVPLSVNALALVSASPIVKEALAVCPSRMA